MNKKFILLALSLTSLLPLIGLLHGGLPVTHDGQDHVARIANFYQSLGEGTIVPRWAGNLNWGYGHPILMFLYPLPSYVASFFRVLGFSFVDSTKLVFGVMYVASFLTMYLWMRAAWGTLPAVIGALLYGYAPYRFVDLYVRGAIGEHAAFVFPPVVLYGLLRLASRSKSKDARWDTLITTFGFAGLILAHNAISLMFIPLIGCYMAYLWKFEAKNRTLFALLSTVSLGIGFAVSAFFWLPAYAEGKYTLRDIVTKGGIADRFVPWINFFYSPWNYGGGNEITKEIGVAHWIGILGAALVFFREKSVKMKWFISGCIVLFIIILWLMTKPALPVWNTVSILSKFQFPWRLLSVTTFLAATLGAIAVTKIPKRFSLMTLVGIIILLGSLTYNMWKPVSYLDKDETFYSSVYNGTTDTGESSPIWSVRFMESRPKTHLEVIDGDALIAEGARTSTKHTYTVSAAADTWMLENTLYFPGWKLFVDGRQEQVEYQNPTYRGIMTFRLAPGEHEVMVLFGDTRLRMISNVISVVGVLLALGLVAVLRKL